jgi:hypothetical protein
MKRTDAPRRFPGMSWVLLVLGFLCLAQGLSKALLWFGGTRAAGIIEFQENTISTRGATWVRYQFTAKNGQTYDGTAMTAAKRALRAKVKVAYLPVLPDVNMPAYGGYTVLMGMTWSLLGLLLLGVRRRLKPMSKPALRR